jgi:hypothetical protein
LPQGLVHSQQSTGSPLCHQKNTRYWRIALSPATSLVLENPAYWQKFLQSVASGNNCQKGNHVLLLALQVLDDASELPQAPTTTDAGIERFAESTAAQDLPV